MFSLFYLLFMYLAMKQDYFACIFRMRRGESPPMEFFYPLLQLKEYVTAPSVKPKFNTDFLLTYKFCTNHEYVNVFVLICSRNSFGFATCTKHLNLQRIGRRNYSML